MPDLATRLVTANFPGYPNGGAVPPGSSIKAILSQPVFNASNGKAVEPILIGPINPATGDMGFWDTVGTPAVGLRLIANDDANAKPQGTYWRIQFVIPGETWPEIAVVVSTGDPDPVLLAALAQPVGGTVAYGVQFDDGTTTLPNVTRVTVTNGSLSGTGNHATVATGGGGGGGAHIIEDEGTPLTARAKLNFIGAGVTATDNAGANSTDVTIPSGGPPTGAAGGDLAGTYPNPTLAAAGTAGTYAYPASVTTDSKGRVTGVTAGAAPIYSDEAFNFTAAGDAIRPFATAATLNIAGVQTRGTGTLTYFKSLAASPNTYNSISGSVSFAVGDALKVTCATPGTLTAVAIPRTA